MNELRPPRLLDEALLLRRTATYARRLAPCLCNRSPETGASCDWYHGFWPYLRILGVSSSAKHRPLFEEGLARVAGDGGLKRLMIAGGADNALLVQFVQACRAIAREPEIAFVDRCATPVMLNRWTAHKLGVRFDSHVSQLLDYRPASPFDVICCHNTLIFMQPEDRAPILRHWRSLLRPGGRLLLISNIRPHTGVDPATFERERVERLESLVHQEYKSAVVDLARDDLLKRARSYAINLRNRHITSDQEFSDLIDRKDWDIKSLRFGPLGVYKGEPAADGDKTQRRRYAWLEAVRR